LVFNDRQLWWLMRHLDRFYAHTEYGVGYGVRTRESAG